MAEESRRRKVIVIVIVVATALLILLLARCHRESTESVDESRFQPTPETNTDASPAAAERPPGEILAPATLQAPEHVSAGAAFSVAWTGPGNPNDYIAIARPDAAPHAYTRYRNTSEGATLDFTAPIETGDWELRYVAGRSPTVLGRARLTVTPIAATLACVDEVVMGADFSVTWSGPDNEGDYITVVTREAPDGSYGHYTLTKTGSPLVVKAPIEAGDGEVRYMTGQGNTVIGRRPIRFVVPDVNLLAPARAVAGSTIEVTWTGPDNAGDYITIVARTRPDGQYGNYGQTAAGSPMSLLTPIEPGSAEVRYMTGQGAKVLARRAITLLPVEASLSAPDTIAAGAAISVTWTGPNYARDYITVVPKDLPDGHYHNYADARAGSPLTIKAPDSPGDYEIRYVTGQGGKTIARRSIRVTK